MLSIQELLVVVARQLDRLEGKVDALAPSVKKTPLTIAEAAELANVSQDMIRRAIAAREIRFTQARPGGPIRIDSADLAKWMRRGTVEPLGLRRAR